MTDTRKVIVSLMLVSMGIGAKAYQQPSPPQDAPDRPKVGVISTPGCPLRLESARISDDNNGPKQAFVDATNTSDEDLVQGQLLLFTFSTEGREQPSQLIDLDPNDLPLHPGKRTTLTLPSSLTLDADFLRFGVATTGPGGDACTEKSARDKAETEFIPDVVLLNPPESPIHLSDGHVVTGNDPLRPQISFTVSNPGSDPIGGVRISVFSFLFEAGKGWVVREQNQDANHPTILAGATQQHIVSPHLLSIDGARWKFVVTVATCTMGGQNCRLPAARKSADAALEGVGK